MNVALGVFRDGIRETRQMTAVYDHFVNDLHISHNEVADILRAQVVNAVSSFDRLLHELVRKGVVECFTGIRTKTNKFLNQQFKAETLIKSIEFTKSGFIPTSAQDTPQYLVEQEMAERLSFLAFQAPDKVKDALSMIWDEPHKMQVLAVDMNLTGASLNDKQKKLEQQLQLIVDRRNQIAHEGDVDPFTHQKRQITREQAHDTIDFMEKLGVSIHKFVTASACYVAVTP